VIPAGGLRRMAASIGLYEITASMTGVGVWTIDHVDCSAMRYWAELDFLVLM